MTHRKNQIYIHFAIAVLILSLALPAAAGAQTEPTTLYVNPATFSATTCPSSTIEVAISVEDVQDLTAFHLEIYFDPDVIQVDGIEPAEFIIGEGETYLPEPSNNIDNVNGFISWGLAKQGTGGDPNPVSGTGDLILITLHAIVPNDSSPIDIDAANSILVNWPDAFEIPFTATDGVVNTSSCPPTDIALSNNTIQENMPIGTTIGTFSSTDPDGDTTFTYTLVNPTGYPDNGSFTITGSTLKSAVSFNYEAKNSYHIRVRSTDPWGAYYEEVFSILIIDVNDAPVLAPIGNKTAYEGTLLTFTALATDEDEGQTLTFSLIGAPTNANIDSTTGVFAWTPGELDGGQSFTFTICVTDGVFSDCETITVTVNEVNVAPVLAEIGDKEVDELDTLEFTATATDADLPVQTLVFSLAAGAEGEVPEGAAITAAGVFTWTPTEAQGPGSYTFDVCVSDGLLSDCETITVTVNEVNVAPVLAEIGDKSVDELAVLTFTATATDADLPVQTLVFSLADGAEGEVPEGAAITAAGVFTWTPTEAQGPGTYTFDVCVSDGLLSDCETITVTVNEVNVAPVLAEIGDKSVDELAVLTFTATATDADLPVQTLVFSLADGAEGEVPEGAAITVGGVFTWTPTEAQGPGSYTFDVCVSDGLLSDCETITVTVNEVNVAPVLAEIGDKSVDELAVLTFTATATDADLPVQTLVFSLAAGAEGEVPEGAAITAAGVFTWTPTEAQGPGTYTFDVCVSDGLLSDCETITVTVNEVNVAPVLAEIGDKSVDELAVLTFTATATDADLPVQTLVFSLAAGAEGEVPEGAAITVGGVFTWTPTEAQGPGTYTFDVCVSDGLLSDCETITVTVNEVNVAPVLAEIGDKEVDELDTLEFTATATDIDEPAQTLTFSLTGAPAGALIDPSTGEFTWTPSEAQGPGTYTFSIKVCDDGAPILCDEKQIEVTVYEVNVPPVAVNDTYGAVKNQVLTILAPGVMSNDTDADLPVNTLTAELVADIPAGEGILVFATSGAFSYTPPTDFLGNTSFTYKVFDGSDYSNIATVTITVSEGNLPPTDIIMTDQTILENQPIGTIVSYLSSVDPNLGDTFTYTLVDLEHHPDNAFFSIDGNRLLSAEIFDYETKDSYTIRIRTTDQGGLWFEKNFVITILDVNDAPVAYDQSVTTPEDTALDITLTGSDQDGDTLTFAVIAQPMHGILTGVAPNLTYTPAANYNGPDSFTFNAADSQLVSNVATVSITVTPVNDAPILSPIGNKSINELELLTFTASATDIDEPAQTLTFSLMGAPAGALIDPSTGEFTWTPTEAQGPGSYTFSVCVSDGTASVCETITVTVYEVNVAPVLGAIGNKTTDELVLLNFTATATDADLPANTLTFTLADGAEGQVPTGASINPSTGLFTWTPNEAQGPGTYTFDVCVSDGTLSDCETITVTVNEVNVAPNLGPIGNKTVNELANLTFTATATDSDIPVQTLTFSLQDGIAGHVPAGAVINSSTGVFTWTPTEEQGPGVYTFDVCVSDGTLSDCETITVTVNEVNVAPILGPIGNKTTDELVLLNFTATATDADLPANTLTFTLADGAEGQVPTGASINPSTGLFTWTPTEAQGPGTYTFDVCVSDGTLSDCETITVTVNEVNVPPELDPIGDQEVDELDTLTFTAAATDADIPEQTLTFSLVNAPEGALIDPTSGEFTWTPTEAQGPGEYTFEICVSDGVATVCETITVTVNEVNIAPVLLPIGNKTTDELVVLTFTATATDADLPANTLTFTLADGAEGQVPTSASINPSTGVFTWTPTEVQGPGTYTFDVCVSDGVATVCETITVTVNEVNVSPVLGAIGNKTVNELAHLTFTATATDSDIPVQTLTFSLEDGTAGHVPTGASIDPSTGAFTWTPTEAQGPGTYTFDVCVSDGALSDCETITVTVNEVNLPPVLNPIGNQEVDELDTLTFTATASDSDIPAQTLTFSLEDGTTGEVPDGATIDPDTGEFTWTPTEAQGPGEYTFDVCVSDGVATVCETITVTVNEINIPPVAQDMTVTTAEDTSLDIPLDVYDADGNPLTVIIVTQPLHGSLVIEGLTVTYTPYLNYNGPDSFVYKVNDGLADSNTATVSITVTPVNDPPVAYGATVETMENTAVDFELLATDPDGDFGTYHIVTEPEHGTLECDGRYCTYTPDSHWFGTDSLVFKVNDGELDSNEATVVLIVHPLPRIYLPLISK